MLKSYLEFINESKGTTEYTPTNMVEEICISMLLLNNEFLDNILDRGLKARYSENSQVFLTDLKNLLLAKNRFKLGRFMEEEVVEDQDLSKVNTIFSSIEFDIEKDWDKLVSARTTARAIIDKLDPEEKLIAERIKSVYWIGINKTDKSQEDIVIETNEGKKYSICLNRNLSLQKSSSFNTFADEFMGIANDQMFSQNYQPRWDKLTKEWVRITYEGARKDIQRHIEKFIDPKRIDSIGYFDYFDIRHRDKQFRYLGEYMKEFDKNILKFNELMKEIWKKEETFFLDPERTRREWTEAKIVILNSKILEHLLTSFLLNNKADEIKKMDNGFKKADGTVKMKLMKILVEKLGCTEKDVFYVSKKGTKFHKIPSRQTFRSMYDNIDILFDYHVKFNYHEDEEEKNDFNFRIKLLANEEELFSLDILVKFSSGEFSNRLTSKYKFDIPDNFNYKLAQLTGDDYEIQPYEEETEPEMVEEEPQSEPEEIFSEDGGEMEESPEEQPNKEEGMEDEQENSEEEGEYIL